MTPFREPPEVELGPLDVGLTRAAARAILRLPRGGRLVTLARNGRLPLAAHATGALGSAGTLALMVAAGIAWTTGWVPATIADFALSAVAVIGGGTSLAAVLRAADRTLAQGTRSGDEVGQKARWVLARMIRAALHAPRSRFHARRAVILTRALEAAVDPDLERWIPADVRGRAELLLARLLAADGGPTWTHDAARRAEIRALLVAASSHLDHPGPAAKDLGALDAAPRSSRALRRRGRDGVGTMG